MIVLWEKNFATLLLLDKFYPTNFLLLCAIHVLLCTCMATLTALAEKNILSEMQR